VIWLGIALLDPCFTGKDISYITKKPGIEKAFNE
jgi:hypothetical protein